MSKLITKIRNIRKLARPADPGKPGWKLNAAGGIEMRDGNPVYIQADGTEVTMGHDTIARLNGESKRHRERAEAAEATAAKFAGIDPVKAKEALETVSKIDAKTLIDAGEVDRVKAEIAKTFTDQLAEKDAAMSKVTGKLHDTLLSSAFQGSKFITDRVAVPVDMLRAAFAKNFKFENDAVVAYDNLGNKIVSRKKAGEYADFDEAVELLINDYPHKDAVLKAPGSSGSGNRGGGGERKGNGPTYRRADFDAMTPAEQSHISGLVNKGEAALVD